MYSTDKVILTQVLSEDSNRLFKWINDPVLVHFNSSFSPVDDLSHAEWFDKVRKDRAVRIFAIRKINNKELIGTCQLHSIHPIHRSAELQIRIGQEDQQGKGFGTDAVNLLLKFGFNELGLNRIFLHVFDSNERATRVYEKAGMKVEGKLREGVFIDGEFKSILVLAILKREFSNK